MNCETTIFEFIGEIAVFYLALGVICTSIIALFGKLPTKTIFGVIRFYLTSPIHFVEGLIRGDFGK